MSIIVRDEGTSGPDCWPLLDSQQTHNQVSSNQKSAFPPIHNDAVNIFDCSNSGHEYFIHLDHTPKLTYLRNYNVLYYLNERNLSKEEIMLWMSNTYY